MIERFAGDFDAIDFEDFVVDRQETRGFGETSGNEARDEDAREFRQAGLGNPHAHA